MSITFFRMFSPYSDPDEYIKNHEKKFKGTPFSTVNNAKSRPIPESDLVAYTQPLPSNSHTQSELYVTETHQTTFAFKTSTPLKPTSQNPPISVNLSNPIIDTIEPEVNSLEKKDDDAMQDSLDSFQDNVSDGGSFTPCTTKKNKIQMTLRNQPLIGKMDYDKIFIFGSSEYIDRYLLCFKSYRLICRKCNTGISVDKDKNNGKNLLGILGKV